MIVVAFTVNNRPDYLRETLESWSRVRGIADTPVIFACEPGCPEAVEVCKKAGFAQPRLAVNAQQAGVLGNPWVAFSLAFGDPACDFAVLAEEDMVVSPDVLEYFTWCQRYRDDREVLGVTTYQHHEQPGGLPGVGTTRWPVDDEWHFWVWGTWRDRWEKLLRDDWDFTYTENGGGPGQRGWDWRIRNELIRGGLMWMVAPSLCRSQHIGEHGGAHCTPDQFQGLLSACYAGDDVPPQDYQEVLTVSMVSVRFDQRMIAQVRRFARQDGVSVSEFIRRLVAAKAENPQRQPPVDVSLYPQSITSASGQVQSFRWITHPHQAGTRTS